MAILLSKVVTQWIKGDIDLGLLEYISNSRGKKCQNYIIDPYHLQDVSIISNSVGFVKTNLWYC